MPGFGFGHSPGRARPQLLSLAGVPTGLAQLWPGSGWDGSAGSGFSTLPEDPVRITAKPALRLLEPDYQWFTDSLTIGALALANDGGTLIGGIDRVRFHYEGNTLDVLEPTFRTLTRFDGSTYGCLGYWCNLSKPAGQSGDAHLYIEAIPADATMQSRILGPLSYCPVDTLHDFDLTVSPSQPAVAGVNYQDVTPALQFLKSVGAQNPRIRITEPHPSGYYGLPTSSPNYPGGTGRCLIEADVPVAFGFPSYVSDIANSFRALYGGLHFRGSNIIFDAVHMARIAQEQAVTNNWVWLDGVEITSSTTTPYWRAGTRPFFMFVESGTGSWFTECSSERINDPFRSATLARGNIVSDGYNDCFMDTECAVHNLVTDWNSTDPWQTYVPSLTVAGPTGAALSLAGGNETNVRTFTAKVSGTSVATFKVRPTETQYNLATAPGFDATTAGEGYFIQDVADWLNSLPGWTATVLNNDRRATAMSFGTNKGVAFSDVDVSGAGQTFTTYFDVHTDLFKQNVNGPEENVVWAFNRATGVKGQVFFVTEETGARDWFILNNAVENLSDPNLIQLSFDHSHVVIAHNTVPNQPMLLRSSQDYTPDSYAMIACNVIQDLYWSLDGPLGSGTIKDNILDFDKDPPASSTGTVTAGTFPSKVPGAASGDFTPAGELLTNLVDPVFSPDIAGLGRLTTTAAGALRIVADP
ncbi:MAG: hypothetical protein ACX930_11285 [Erythrobacter sp.]